MYLFTTVSVESSYGKVSASHIISSKLYSNTKQQARWANCSENRNCRTSDGQTESVMKKKHAMRMHTLHSVSCVALASPWKMTTWKNMSNRRIRSGRMLLESKRTGCNKNNAPSLLWTCRDTHKHIHATNTTHHTTAVLVRQLAILYVPWETQWLRVWGSNFQGRSAWHIHQHWQNPFSSYNTLAMSIASDSALNAFWRGVQSFSVAEHVYGLVAYIHISVSSAWV